MIHSCRSHAAWRTPGQLQRTRTQLTKRPQPGGSSSRGSAGGSCGPLYVSLARSSSMPGVQLPVAAEPGQAVQGAQGVRAQGCCARPDTQQLPGSRRRPDQDRACVVERPCSTRLKRSEPIWNRPSTMW